MLKTSLPLILLLTATISAQELRLKNSPSIPVAFGLATAGEAFFRKDLDGSGLPDVILRDNGDLKYFPDPDLDGPLAAPVTAFNANLLPSTFFIPLYWVLEDMDGDGDVDIIASRQEGLFAGTNVYRVRNLGGGMFAPPDVLLTTGGKSDRIRSGDFNGDGLRDLILTANSGPAGGTLEVRLQTPGGTFPLTYGEPTGAGDYVVADFDGDGDDDAFYTVTPGEGRLLLGDPSGTITAATPIPIGSNATTVVPVGDVNGDGSPDAYTVAWGSGVPLEIELYLGDPSQVLVFGADLTPSVTPPGSVRELVLLDVDADGRRDVVVQFRDLGNQDFVAYRGDDSGQLSDAPTALFSATLPSNGLPWTAGFIDLDQDGDLDVVRANPSTVTLDRLENRALFGQACPGTTGAPLLTAGAAQPGNGNFALTIGGALPNAPAEIFIATDDRNVACGVLLNAATIVVPSGLGPFSLTTDASGTAALPLPLPAGLAPTATFYVQGFVMDPGGTLSAGSVTLSTTRGRGLRIF